MMSGSPSALVIPDDAIPAAPRPRRIAVRLPELDVMRGAAILLVLYLHSYFRMWPEVTDGERLAVGVSHLFAHGAVPVFLFISGFLLGRDRSPSFGAFASGRLKRIALPGLVWMVLALGYEVWANGGLTSDLVERFVFFDIEGQFYFLLVLAALTTVGYPLRHASARTLGIAAGLGFLAGVLATSWYERQDVAGDLAVFAYRDPTIWAFFFLFGLFACRVRGDVSWGRPIEFAAGAEMLATLGFYLWQGEHGGYPTSYFGVAVFVFSSLGLVVYPALIRGLLAAGAGRLLVTPFAWLAPYSFGIFLVHKPYFLGYLSSRVLEERFEDSWGQLMLANFAVGTIGAIGFVVLADLLSRRFGALLLGVDRPPPERPGDATVPDRLSDREASPARSR